MLLLAAALRVSLRKNAVACSTTRPIKRLTNLNQNVIAFGIKTANGNQRILIVTGTNHEPKHGLTTANADNHAQGRGLYPSQYGGGCKMNTPDKVI
jgi:hypothetical protein